MRKFYLCCLLGIVISVGCVSPETKRWAEGNMFYSAYPKMSMNFSSNFHFVGTRKEEYKANALGQGGGPANYTVEYFTWYSSKLMLMIGIKELKEFEMEWLPVVDICKNSADVREKGGYTKINNHTYAYCVYMSDKGIFHKIYVRNTSDNKIQIQILLIDSTHTSDLNEFEKNCDNVFVNQAGLDVSKQIKEIAKKRKEVAKSNSDQEKIYDLIRIIKKDPNNAEAYYNLGKSYQKQGRYYIAIAQYNKAIEVKPEYADAYISLGDSYKKAGHIEEACTNWKHACDLGKCIRYELAQNEGDCEGKR